MKQLNCHSVPKASGSESFFYAQRPWNKFRVTLNEQKVFGEIKW